MANYALDFAHGVLHAESVAASFFSLTQSGLSLEAYPELHGEWAELSGRTDAPHEWQSISPVQDDVKYLILRPWGAAARGPDNADSDGLVRQFHKLCAFFLFWKGLFRSA